MTEGHYAVRAEDFDRLVAERDETRAEADRLREALRNIDAYVRRGDDHLDKAPFAAEVICRMARAALDGEEVDR